MDGSGTVDVLDVVLLQKHLLGMQPLTLMQAIRANVYDDETIDIYYVNPKAPCFIRDENETYTYLVLPVNFVE